MSDEIKIPHGIFGQACDELEADTVGQAFEIIARWAFEEERRRIISIAESAAMSEGGEWRRGLKFLIERIKAR